VGLQQEVLEARAGLEQGARKLLEAEGQLQRSCQQLKDHSRAAELRQQRESTAYAPAACAPVAIFMGARCAQQQVLAGPGSGPGSFHIRGRASTAFELRHRMRRHSNLCTS
jgi:hypothetical protein